MTWKNSFVDKPYNTFLTKFKGFSKYVFCNSFFSNMKFFQFPAFFDPPSRTFEFSMVLTSQGTRCERMKVNRHFLRMNLKNDNGQINVNKCLYKIKLPVSSHMCSTCFELTSNVSTMEFSLLFSNKDFDRQNKKEFEKEKKLYRK